MRPATTPHRIIKLPPDYSDDGWLDSCGPDDSVIVSSLLQASEGRCVRPDFCEGVWLINTRCGDV